LMSPLRWPLRAWVAIIGRRIARLPADLSAAPLRTWVAGLRKFGGRLWAGPSSPSASRQRNDAAAPGVPRALPSRVARVAASALIASARYRPGLYCGQLTLFTPGRREPGLPSLEAIWRKHARAIAVVETGGEHSTMLSASHAEDTAASVSRWLRASIRS
jgi:hypothetical protein